MEKGIPGRKGGRQKGIQKEDPPPPTAPKENEKDRRVPT